MDIDPIKEIRKIINYNPETGEFTRLLNSHKGKCGYKGSNGNIRMEVKRQVWSGLRLAWMFVYGTNPQHRLKTLNGNNADCRILNIAPKIKENPLKRETRKKEAHLYIKEYRKKNNTKVESNTHPF